MKVSACEEFQSSCMATEKCIIEEIRPIGSVDRSFSYLNSLFFPHRSLDSGFPQPRLEQWFRFSMKRLLQGIQRFLN
jgi:hypothetical protein